MTTKTWLNPDFDLHLFHELYFKIDLEGRVVYTVTFYDTSVGRATVEGPFMTICVVPAEGVYEVTTDKALIPADVRVAMAIPQHFTKDFLKKYGHETLGEYMSGDSGVLFVHEPYGQEIFAADLSELYDNQ